MMSDMVMIILSYCIIIFMSFGILGWLQAGFLMPFLKVKTSRGKKILVKVIKTTGSDFLAAQEIEGQLIFKYKKDQKRIDNYKKGLYRSFNINCIDVDPETWGVVSQADFSAVSTNDPTKTDHLIERALLRPDKKSTKEMIVLLLLIFILLGIIFVAYKLNFLQQTLGTIGAVTGKNI